jgi:hypothetical protein
MPRKPDPKAPEARVVIRDFAGFVPNADPHDLKPGTATEQINATSTRQGELRVRLGTQVLQFES